MTHATREEDLPGRYRPGPAAESAAIPITMTIIKSLVADVDQEIYQARVSPDLSLRIAVRGRCDRFFQEGRPAELLQQFLRDLSNESASGLGSAEHSRGSM